VDGRLVAAAEEERFRRIKHWAGFPSESIRWCLEAGGLTAEAVDRVAVNRDPRANFLRKARFAAVSWPSLESVLGRLRNAGKIGGLRSAFEEEITQGRPFKARICHVEHHRAHLASAFFVSPFPEAAVVSVDGFGDFLSVLWGTGRKNRIESKGQVCFPHSLGLFYLALTQYLGFPKYGDEYKVMGLAAYGKPTRLDDLRRIVKLTGKGLFELDLAYFLHHTEGVSMVWEKGEPAVGRVFSPQLEALLGPARMPDSPIEQRHMDVAASLQAMYEEAFFHLLNHVQAETGSQNLCLAGGCAMNSVANGKVYARTGFRKLYVQSAAGDAGGAIGAAFHLWNETMKRPRVFTMSHAYWGPSFPSSECFEAIHEREADLARENCAIEIIESEVGLCFRAAQAIAEGKVLGWFQGRMEWGPRALGNRSILCDPRRADAKDLLNVRIKRRESFRPFAPSVLREDAGEWFETDDDVPFMLQVYAIRPEKRPLVPAVTHVDGTGRLQTVAESDNPLYHRLLSTFKQLTGVPMLLNTSFNENEPVVCRPSEALDCFLRTKMDALALGGYLIWRR
jgi:carbamoyltransferase